MEVETIQTQTIYTFILSDKIQIQLKQDQKDFIINLDFHSDQPIEIEISSSQVQYILQYQGQEYTQPWKAEQIIQASMLCGLNYESGFLDLINEQIEKFLCTYSQDYNILDSSKQIQRNIGLELYKYLVFNLRCDKLIILKEWIQNIILQLSRILRLMFDEKNYVVINKLYSQIILTILQLKIISVDPKNPNLPKDPHLLQWNTINLLLAGRKKKVYDMIKFIIDRDYALHSKYLIQGVQVIYPQIKMDLRDAMNGVYLTISDWELEASGQNKFNKSFPKNKTQQNILVCTNKRQKQYKTEQPNELYIVQRKLKHNRFVAKCIAFYQFPQPFLLLKRIDIPKDRSNVYTDFEDYFASLPDYSKIVEIANKLQCDFTDISFYVSEYGIWDSGQIHEKCIRLFESEWPIMIKQFEMIQKQLEDKVTPQTSRISNQQFYFEKKGVIASDTSCQYFMSIFTYMLLKQAIMTLKQDHVIIVGVMIDDVKWLFKERDETKIREVLQNIIQEVNSHWGLNIKFNDIKTHFIL